MRRELMWMATAVALAAGLLMYPQAARAQESSGTAADASASAGQDTQANDSAASDAADQATAADQETSDEAGATGAASDAGTDQSTETGPALPPPDASAQQQGSSARVQEQSAQSQPPQTQAAQGQQLSRDGQLNRDQQLDRDRQMDRDGLQSRIRDDMDVSARGEADLRRGMHDRDMRRHDSHDLDLGIHFSATTGRGLVIATIDRDSVLFDSGLREGDVLISLDGRPIRSESEFVEFVQMHPGERVPVVVLRDGRQQTIFITYDHQQLPMDQYQTMQRPVAGSQPFLGVMFDVQIPNAAVVVDVTPGSPAEHAGLRRGDMITAINGQEISSYHDVVQLVRMMRPGDQLVIDYSRQVTDQTQALLAGRPDEVVRTATAPDLRYGRQVEPMPQPIYRDRPMVVPPYGYDRDPRMIDRDRGVRRPLRDRGLLPRLLD